MSENTISMLEIQSRWREKETHTEKYGFKTFIVANIVGTQAVSCVQMCRQCLILQLAKH